MKTGPKPALKVVPAQDAPAVPKWVPEICHDVYERVAAELASKDRLTPGNMDLLESYIATIATARRAERSVARQGSFFRERGKRPQPHPGIAIAQEARKQVRMIAGRLGLIEESRDAARRAGATVEIEDDDDFGGDDI